MVQLNSYKQCSKIKTIKSHKDITESMYSKGMLQCQSVIAEGIHNPNSCYFTAEPAVNVK
jgi:hypothetical protein